MAIQITPWAFSNSNPRSLAGSERGGAVVDRPNPSEGLTGGEGGGVWELHGFKAHLRVVLVCGEGLGGGGSTEQGGLAAEASDGEVAPARFGRWEAAWELREVEA